MATTTTAATARQLDTIATEARRAGWSDPQHAVDAAGISSRNWRYDLNRSDASALIDDLRRGVLTPPAEPERADRGDGAPTAEQALAMLGKTVEIFTNRTITGTVEAIVPSPKDGTPALQLAGDDATRRLSVIRSWALIG